MARGSQGGVSRVTRRPVQLILREPFQPRERRGQRPDCRVHRDRALGQRRAGAGGRRGGGGTAHGRFDVSRGRDHQGEDTRARPDTFRRRSDLFASRGWVLPRKLSSRFARRVTHQRGHPNPRLAVHHRAAENSRRLGGNKSVPENVEVRASSSSGRRTWVETRRGRFARPRPRDASSVCRSREFGISECRHKSW